jgi:periplasmic protein TonB
MAYADQQMSGNKITAFIIVAIIHVAIGYALITGLAYEAAKKVVQKVTTIDIEEEVKKEEPPPPPPKKVDVPPPPVRVVVPPAKVDLSPPKAPPIDTTPIPPPPPPPLPPPPAPPPPRFTPKPPSPKGQSGWARRIQENYPSRAIREQREGRVGVRVNVNTDGRVTSCSVTNSSGSSDLDSAACEGMERYARFDPATNSDGQPTSGSWSTTIVYRLQ